MVTKDIKMGRQRLGIFLKMQTDHNLFEIQTRDIWTPSLPPEDLNILDVQLLGLAVG